MGNIGRTNNAELAHCVKPHGFALLSDVAPQATFCIGAFDDLVVNVRDIRNEADRQTCPREVPAQDVIDQSGTAVTQMGRPVDRWAT